MFSKITLVLATSSAASFAAGFGTYSSASAAQSACCSSGSCSFSSSTTNGQCTYSCNGNTGSCSGSGSSSYCANGCPAHWLNDGVCDSYCNVSACNFDNGDCADSSTTSTSSSAEPTVSSLSVSTITIFGYNSESCSGQPVFVEEFDGSCEHRVYEGKMMYGRARCVGSQPEYETCSDVSCSQCESVALMGNNECGPGNNVYASAKGVCGYVQANSIEGNGADSQHMMATGLIPIVFATAAVLAAI